MSLDRRHLFNPQNHLLQHLATIGEKKLSGILTLSYPNTKRRFLFSSTGCIALTSTNVKELPGSFLFDQKIISKKHLDIYLLKAMEDNVRQWDLAIENIEISSSQLGQYKKKHLQHVCKNIAHVSPDEVLFESRQFPSTLEIVASVFEMMHEIARTFNKEDIFKMYPGLQNLDICIKSTTGFPQETQDKTLLGLGNLLKEKQPLSYLFEHSLLSQDQILQHLLIFDLLKWVEIQSASEDITESFIASLNQQDLLSRQEVIELAKLVEKENYYQYFGIPPTSDQKIIEKSYLELKSKLSNFDPSKIFSPTEENKLIKVHNKIEEAYLILSSPTKRKEFDHFLKSGKVQGFLKGSRSIAHEKALNRFYELQKANQIEKSVQFAYAYLTKDPSPIQFSIVFIEFILTTEFVKQSKYQNLAFGLLKHHIEYHGDRYEPFFLLGKLCMLLRQEDNASKAFMRALETRPDIPSLRKFIIEKTGVDGPMIVARAIANKMDTMNLYQLIAVDPKATPAQIHRAYRLCCRYFHPDRYFHSASIEIKKISSSVFKKMVQAYRTLKNIKKRQAYDIETFGDSQDIQSLLNRKPPTHFKAKEFFGLARQQLSCQDYAGAIVNLDFALQHEPDNLLLQEELQRAKSLKKAH